MKLILSLQLPLKRFRPDDHSNLHGIESITTTPEHVYQHGQPTPPSPSHIPLRVWFFISILIPKRILSSILEYV